MSVWRALVCTMGVCVVVAAIGCGGSGNFATVSGLVTHNGGPVEGARVEFHGLTEQQDGAMPQFATQTDSSGKYLLSGVGNNPGIPPGMYKVLITKYEGNTALTMPEEGMDAGQLGAQMSDMAPGVGAAQSAVKNHLPDEYASLATSKLSATVEAGKNEDVNFELQ